jgi:hypothetical protein
VNDAPVLVYAFRWISSAGEDELSECPRPPHKQA